MLAMPQDRDDNQVADRKSLSLVLRNQVDRKDTYTLGEEFTIGGVLKPATSFTGPVNVVTGIHDYPFCLGNCSFPDNQLSKVKPQLYPAANAGSDIFLVPENGHYINAHRSAGKAFDQINGFLRKNGL